MHKKTQRTCAALTGAGVLVFTLAGSCDATDSAQSQAQAVTNAYQQAAQQAVPYPLDDMKSGGWLERTELAEHLKRQNDKKAMRWVILLTQQGQVVSQWPIQGMVFDPNSQMTNSQTINGCAGGSGACGVVTESPGDNGTWGPEAGEAAFFTASGVEIQLPKSATWVEADAPLNLTTQPLITYNIADKPSTNHGGVKVGH